MPKSGGTVLLVIDVINDLSFDGAEKVLPWAKIMAERLAPVCRKARQADIPVIYVNDNFGQWRSDFRAVYKHCTKAGTPGAPIVKKLKPAESDYFILKPRHSAFFATSLVPLLEHLNAGRLIIAGLATNICVLFTANDAHMHEYEVVVLSDCCAAESDFDHNTALSQLKRFLGATICRGDEVEFDPKPRKSKPKGRKMTH